MRLKNLCTALILLALVLGGCTDSDNDFVFTGTPGAGAANNGNQNPIVNPGGILGQLIFLTNPNRTAGQNFNVIQVQIQDTNGNLIADATNPVTIALNNPGGATLSGTTTRNAVAGVATFDDLRVDRVGQYSFTASSPGFTSSASVNFNITPGQASAVSFTQQPSNVAAFAPITPAVQVMVTDDQGNPTDAAVTIALGNNPSGANLGGTLTQNTTNGVATFNDLVLNAPGAGFTLTADTASTAPVASTAFNATGVVALQRIYVSDEVNNSISVFAIDANGDVAPVRTIVGANTMLSQPRGMAIGRSNELYVANMGNNSITVYAPRAAGDIAPIRRVAGGNTGLSSPMDVEINRNTSEMYVACMGNNSVRIFDDGANGDIASGAISGGMTGLNGPHDLAFDGGNTLAVANNGSITVFDLNMGAGNIAPDRTITGAATGLTAQSGITFFADDIFAGSDSGVVRQFSDTADGNVAPLLTLSGANTGLGTNLIDDVDIESNMLYLADYMGGSVRVFPSGGLGNIAPNQVITGGNTGLTRPASVVVGPD